MILLVRWERPAIRESRPMKIDQFNLVIIHFLGQADFSGDGVASRRSIAACKTCAGHCLFFVFASSRSVMPSLMMATSSSATHACSVSERKININIGSARGEDGWVIAPFTCCLCGQKSEIQFSSRSNRSSTMHPRWTSHAKPKDAKPTQTTPHTHTLETHTLTHTATCPLIRTLHAKTNTQTK